MSADSAPPRRRSARLAAQAHAMQAARQAAPPSSLSSLSSLSDLPLSSPPTPAPMPAMPTPASMSTAATASMPATVPEPMPAIAPAPTSAPVPTSTPASATPSSDPKWDRLYEFLSASEIPLRPDEFASSESDCTMSASNFYERHLAKCYQLRSIRVLDTLPEALSLYARRTFDTIRSSTHDPPTEWFLMKLKFYRRECESRDMAVAEPGVEEFYRARALCWSTLGSMQHLQTGRWDALPLVYWSRDVLERAFGTADGVFRVRSNHNVGNLWNLMGDTERHNWQMLRDRAVKLTLANWEFKSLSVGSEPVMQEVQRLEGSFQWEACNECQDCSHHISVAASTTPGPGPDAMWSSTVTWLEGCSSAFPDHDCPSNPNLESATAAPSASTSSSVCIAHSMVQQIWAQAVSTDNTFMYLSSGNYEFIGIRHRHNQVLYLSPLIDRVSIGQYGWLQTGLYLAIIEDALARFSLGDSSSVPPNGDDLDPEDDPDSMHSGQSGGCSGGGGNKGGTEYHPEDSGGSTSTDMSTLNMISTACVCLQYGVFDSVNPSQFICHSNPTGTFPTEQPHLHALVTLTSKIAEGATGHVHGGILEVEDIKLPIVMKIGFDPEEVQQLQHEHHIYDLLYKAGVQVSTVYGLFKEDHGDSNATGLIMSYGGSNLEKLSKVTKKQSESFLETLQGIHNAGILHSDIHPRNLLVDDAGRTTIIDFAYSVTNTPQHELNSELKELSNLLLQLQSASS